MQKWCLATLAAAAVSVASVFADDSPYIAKIRTSPITTDRPMIEVGASTRVTSQRPGVDVLLEAEFRGIPGRKPQQYWAHIQAGAGINTADGQLSSLDVTITPYSKVSSMGAMPLANAIELFPVHVFSDLNLGTKYGASIKVLKWGGGLYIPPTEVGTITATLAIAVDALGAKFTKFNNQSDDFIGAYIGGIAAELDLGYKFDESWVVKVGLGAGTNFSVGDSHGLSLQMESNVHVNATLSYKRFLDFFATGQFRRLQDTGNSDTFTVWEFMAGVKFYVD